MTGPIGRIIFERADRSGYYAFTWDATLAVALLAGGACSVRSEGAAYSFTGPTDAVSTADPPVLAIHTVEVPGTLGNVAISTPASTDGGDLIWLPKTAADAPPTVTVNGKPFVLDVYQPVTK